MVDADKNLPEATKIEAKLFNGFADPSRLSILKSLINGNKSVSEIVEITSLSQPNVSAHLSCLKDCGLVKDKRSGQQVIYSLADKTTVKLLRLGQKILEKVSADIYKCANY